MRPELAIAVPYMERPTKVRPASGDGVTIDPDTGLPVPSPDADPVEMPVALPGSNRKAAGVGFDEPGRMESTERVGLVRAEVVAGTLGDVDLTDAVVWRREDGDGNPVDPLQVVAAVGDTRHDGYGTPHGVIRLRLVPVAEREETTT